MTGGAASSLPLGASGATTTQMTEIISLVSKLLSKLNMLLPFHKNKADALQFLSNKSVFRIVLQTGKLDFTTLKKMQQAAFPCPSFCPDCPCVYAISFPLGLRRLGKLQE